MTATWLGASLLAALDLGLGLAGSSSLLVRTVARGLLVALASWRLSGRLFPEEGPEARAVTSLLLAYAGIGVLLRGLSLVGGLGDLGVAAVTALVALATLRGPEPDPAPGARPAGPLAPGSCLAYAAALAWLARGELRTWGDATIHYDALNYHLEWVAQFRAEGTLAVLVNPATSILLPFFARAAALWSLFFLLPGAALDPLQRHLDMPFAFGCVLVVALLARELDVPEHLAAPGAALLVLSPQIASLTPLGGNDLALAFCMLATLWAAERWQRARGPAEAARFGLALGMAFATKYLVLLYLPALVAVLLWPRRRLPHRGAALLALALVTVPDFGRNLVGTGNPFYPTGLEVGGVTLLPGLENPKALLLDSEDFGFTPEVGEALAGPLWPLLLVGVLVAPFAAGRPHQRLLRGVPLAMLVLYAGLFPVHYLRWLVAPLGVALAATLSLLVAPGALSGAVGPLVTAAAAAALLLAVPLGERLAQGQQARQATWDDYGAYRKMAEAWRAVDGLVPEDARLLVLGDSLTYPYRGTLGARTVLRLGDLHLRDLEGPGFPARLQETVPLPGADPVVLRAAVAASAADWVVLQRQQYPDGEAPRSEALWAALTQLEGFRLVVEGRRFRLFARPGAAARRGPPRPSPSRPPRVVHPEELRGL